MEEWTNYLFRKASGLPDDAAQSLFQDDRGRIWVFTGHGLAYFKDGRFVAVNGVPGGEVYSITGDKAGNLWLSENRGLSHMLDGRLVEHFPWSALGRRQQAKVVLSIVSKAECGFHSGATGACCISRMVRSARRTQPLMGWVRAHVPGLQLDRDGALWAATEEGGLSRIKDGRIATLTTRNGLPCDTIHWTIEDDDRSFWLYTACGLVRIARTELDAWIADPKRRIETTVWDAADGVRLRSVPPSAYGPPVAKSTDGKLWFVTGEGVQVVDPRHLAVNKLPPPVHIEQVMADGKTTMRRTQARGCALPCQRPRPGDRLHGAEPGGAGEGPFQIHAGGPGPGLEGSHQRPPGAVFESAAAQVPLPRNRLQQQRSVERAGRLAGVLHRPGVLPDELVPRALRGCFSGTALGGVPVPCPATAVGSST